MKRIQAFNPIDNLIPLVSPKSLLKASALLVALFAAPVAMAQPSAAPTPKIPYWSQWTDKAGETHTTKCFMSGLESQPFAAAPQFVRRFPGPVESTVFTQLPVGWVGDWHANPKRQWVMVLSGEYYMETSDGTSATLRAGDVFFGGDQGAKPNKADPKKIGHFSRVNGNVPSDHVIIQLKGEPEADKINVACPY